MLIAGRQTVIKLPGEGNQLDIRKAEVLLNRLQHDVHNQLHGVGKGGVSQLVYHQQKEFADCPVILVASLLQGEQHVSDENQRYMGAECVVGQGMAF